jgi:UDP-glucose 4-epimerase
MAVKRTGEATDKIRLMPRALVTGGAGFIGSHLACALIAEGWSVDVVDNLSTGVAANVPAEAELIELDLGAHGTTRHLPAHRYEAICHLAGQSSGEKSFDDPAGDLDANARSTIALAGWAREQRIPLVVHASSMGVYGDVASQPVDEHTPPRPISFYGVSKLAAEHALAVAPDVRAISLRMFSIYGPGQDLDEMRQGMVSIFLSMALRGEPIAVRGPLDRVRDFVYVEDCVEAWTRALASSCASGAINVGTGTGTSIRELLAQMLEVLGAADYPVRELEVATPGDQFAIAASTARARELLGWEARTDLRSGLETMVRWGRATAR